jgi:6-phosphogluconate dehydrogenase
VDASKRLVDMILDRAAQKGTGLWTSVSALELHIPTPAIDEAVAARDLSAYKKERVIIDGFTPAITANSVDKKQVIQSAYDALYFGMAVSYIQGLHLLQTASDTYKYDINMAEVVRIWKGGCIIRSAMLNDIRKAFVSNTSLKNLLLDKTFYSLPEQKRNGLVTILKAGMDNKIALPVLSSSLNYFDMFNTGRSASNLIQAQRDFFGAHTYERIDKEGSFHTNWN